MSIYTTDYPSINVGDSSQTPFLYPSKWKHLLSMVPFFFRFFSNNFGFSTSPILADQVWNWSTWWHLIVLKGIDIYSFLDALRLNSCLRRFARSSIALTSRSNSLPVCNTRWKVAFLWSACLAYRILLCESIRACMEQMILVV